MKKTDIKGLHPYRFKDNPDERKFAEAWASFAPMNLGWLLHVGDQNGPRPTCDYRDEVVAATVIQWLGSPVGKNFLRDLGWVKK